MTAKKPNVDGGYAWVVLAALILIDLLVGMMWTCVGILITAIVEEIEDDITKASVVGSTFFGTATLMGPISGLLQDRIGHRWTGVASGIFLLVGFASASFCKTITGLICTFGFIAGVGASLAMNITGVAPGSYFVKKLSMVYGLLQVGGGCGVFMIGPITVLLLDMYHLSGTLLILGGIMFHVSLAGALIRPNTVIQDEETLIKPAEDSSQVEAGVQPASGQLAILVEEHLEIKDNPTDCLAIMTCHALKLLQVLRSNGFYVYLFSSIFWTLGDSACLLHLPNYAESKGSTPTQAATVLTGLGVASILSSVLTGFVVSDPAIGNILINFGSLGMSGALTVLFPLFSHSFYLQTLFSTIYGLYSQTPFTLVGPICIQLVGIKNLAFGFGLTSFVTGLGYLAGPPIASLIYENSGVYDSSFIFAGCCLLASAFLLALVPMFKSRPQEGEMTKEVSASILSEKVVAV